jgi:hypothetical protein
LKKYCIHKKGIFLDHYYKRELNYKIPKRILSEAVAPYSNFKFLLQNINKWGDPGTNYHPRPKQPIGCLAPFYHPSYPYCSEALEEGINELYFAETRNMDENYTFYNTKTTEEIRSKFFV